MSDPNERDEERPRARPRVVDKRVSSRTGEAPAAPSTPSEPPPADTTAPAGPPAEAESPPAPPGEVWTPEAEAEARRMLQEMAAVPAADWVVNQAITLANVAGAKLETGAVDEARLAIDALAGIVGAVEGKVGDAGPALRQVLSQLQLAVVGRPGGPPAGP